MFKLMTDESTTKWKHFKALQFAHKHHLKNRILLPQQSR